VEYEDDEGNMQPLGDGHYYSSPAMAANIEVVRLAGRGTEYYIYLDSVLYAFGNNGLEIYDMLEDRQDGGALAPFFNDSRLNGVTNPTAAQKEMARYYVEYGALAGDFTGDGRENLHVSQYFLHQELKTSWETVEWQKVQKRYWWFWTRTWWVPTTVQHEQNYTIHGDFNVYAFYAQTDSEGTITGMNTKVLYDGGKKLDKYYCLVNTDQDTSFMEYTGRHYVVYTDPEVLAVIASAPFFKDVANMEGGDDHVGNSETTYSSSTGSEQGSTTSNTISAGAYFGIDAEITVFGVQVASFEMETEYSHGWTWETEKTSTLEQTITYGTAAGEDAVAFYSIPMEVYEYTLYTPVTDSSNRVIGYEEQTMTVNIPHTAAVSVLSLDKYESIAADYPELPRISGTVLTHEIGDPATYPSSANGYRDAEVYSGNWAGVGYGSGFIAQEIAMGTGTTKSYSQTNSFSFKIGGGAGVVKAGVTVGSEWGRGTATTTTEGSTFAATIVNMPLEAEDYGYYFAWKLFTYNYSDGRTSFPVVNFLVTDVTTPPTVPDDFDWDTETTTDTSVDLTWSYTGNVSHFVIYREYNFAGTTGMVNIAEVPASDSEDYDEETNSRTYRYRVEGLSAYQDYKFQIQVVGTAQPTTSAPSIVLEARTKTDRGYPDFALSTRDLLVYPDAVGTVTLNVSYNGVDGSIAYKTVLYQWQKLIDGQWTNMPGTSDYNGPTMRIRNAGMSSAGKYRCRVNVIYYDVESNKEYYLTAYSDAVNVSYSKRTSRMQGLSATTSSSVSKPTLSVSIENTHGGSAVAPTGTVTFFIKGVDYSMSYDASLETVSGKTYSTATVSSGDISALPDGIFEINAYYGGNRIFRSCESEKIIYKSGSSDGYWLELSENAVYGDRLRPTLYLVKGYGMDAERTTVSEDVYQVTYNVNGGAGWVNGSEITAKAVGGYTVTASVYGSGVVASKQITVSPFKLTLVAPSYTHTANTGDVAHPSVNELKIYQNYNTDDEKEILSLPNDDTLENLGLYIRAINSAFKEGTILKYNPDSGDYPGGTPPYGDLWFYSPGKYTLVAALGSGANSDKLANYEITSVTGTYILTAATFPVYPSARLLNGQVRGAVEVTSPGDFVPGKEYQNGTQVTFKATPYEGYEVKAWYIASSIEGLSNAAPYQVAGGAFTGTYLNYTMTSEPLYVDVEFRVAQRTINFGANNDGFGSVVCTSSPFLTDGAVFASGTDYTFTAIPASGYHFVNWVVSGAASYTDTTNETITLTGGNTSITLRAVFERDRYVLTLNGDLQAYYFDDTDNDAGTADEKVIVFTGAQIPGGKDVVVEPKSGYSVEADSWSVDGLNIGSSDQSYRFTMTADTTISANTYYNGYEIELTTTQATNGDSTVTVSQDISQSITGGTKIIFTANPTYGTRFAGWKINGSADFLPSSTEALSLSANGRTLTINAIGRDYDIEAVFENNHMYHLTLTKAAYGTMTVTVTNPTYGTVDNPSYEYDNGKVSTMLEVYQGDVINLSTAPAQGFRVFYWKEDAKTTQTNVTSWTINNIQADKSIEVDFSATGFYTVTYRTDSGGSVSGKIDGVPFSSGNQSLGAGTTISIEAVPGTGNMLDCWMVNGEVVLNGYGKPLVDKEYRFLLNQNSDVRAVFSPLVTNTIDQSGDHATLTVTDVSPADYAQTDARGSYTQVREGAYAKMTIAPDAGYYIYGVTLTEAGTGNQVEFDVLNKGDYQENAPTGETWIGEIYAVTDNITVNIDARPIHQVTFTPDESEVGMVLSAVPHHENGESKTYNENTETYYVRDGSKMNLTITPDNRYYIYDATVAGVGGALDILTSSYRYGATGESWTGEIVVGESITVTVDARPIHEVTFTPDDSSVEMVLSEIPHNNNGETKTFPSETETYYVRDGSKMNLTITPDNRYYIYHAAAEGNDGDLGVLTSTGYRYGATGENWTGEIVVEENITVTVDTRPIHEVTFTPDHSTVEMVLSEIPPVNNGETKTYPPETGTYYVRGGSKMTLTIRPDHRYFIYQATVEGENGEMDVLTRDSYSYGERGENWTGVIEEVAGDITVTVDTKTIHELTFTPDDSVIVVTVSNIRHYDETETVTYTAGTGTYYVREGAQVDLSISPNSGYALVDVTNGSTIIGETGFSYEPYSANAEQGETWVYTISSVDTGAAFVVDSKPIHEITVAPDKSTVIMNLSGPCAWYTESNSFTEDTIRKARDGANAVFTIVPNMYRSIKNVSVTGAVYTITKDFVSPVIRTGGTWTVTVDGTYDDITLTVETVFNPSPSPGGGGGAGANNTPQVTNEITPPVTERNGKAAAAIADKEAASILKYAQDNNSSDIVVSVNTKTDVSLVETKLPAGFAGDIVRDTNADLVMKSDLATIRISNAALKEIAGQAARDDMTISVEKMNKEKLTEEQAAIAGDNPVFDLAIKSGGQRITSFGGENVTVAIPCELKDGQDAQNITVYYLADDGTIQKVENAVFDAKRGIVEFKTDHFSYYMITEEKTLSGANPFSDVSVSDWYYEDVSYAYQNGLMKGTAADKFSPGASTNRAMVVTILYRLEGEPAAPPADFPDVAEEMYYHNAVAWANASGIVTGYGKLFRPNDSITREQLAAMLYRYDSYKGFEALDAGDITQFNDAENVSGWAVDAVKWAVGTKIMNGKDQGMLDPQGNATRAEVAAMIKRWLEH
jgi:hypothetical protein